MMATTHALAGLVLAALASAAVPGVTPAVALAAAAGGIFPDLDLAAAHRKTLHFPGYYAVAAVVASGVAALVPGVLTLAAALFFAAAALHCAMDVAGGGLALRPWRRTSDRGVYSHVHGRWIPPRRWIRYDGAPEDFVLAAGLAVPCLLVFEGRLQALVVVTVAISGAYALLRKPMIRIAEWVVSRLPERVVKRIPTTMLDVEEL